jgi:glutathione S-transferase
LVDEGVTLRDSQAILVYLASKHGGEAWLPKGPARMAEVVQWLSCAANEVQNGPRQRTPGRQIWLRLGQGRHREAFGPHPALDQRPSCHAPLVGHGPTDHRRLRRLSLHRTGARGWGGLAPYPTIVAWMARVKALPNFVGMPGI